MYGKYAARTSQRNRQLLACNDVTSCPMRDRFVLV